MGLRSYSHSFAGGELSPSMLGHFDDIGYRTGYAHGRNLIVTPTGKLIRRPGFDYVTTAKAGATRVRMLPFIYSSDADDSDSYAMEWGPDYVRFHTDGATALYATPIAIASVTLATNVITTATAHGLAVDTPIRFTHEGTDFPGNVAAGTTYYVLTAPTTTTLTISTSVGGAVFDLITFTTILNSNIWRQSELPREYVTPRQVTRNGNNLDAALAHGLVTTHGDPVFFVTTAADLPAPLVEDTVYYAIYVDTDSFRVSNTLEGAQTAAFTFTAVAATDVITATNHGLVDGTVLSVSSSTSLPGGLSANTNYYVIDADTSTFKLSTTLGGSSVNITSTGSGTHTATPGFVLTDAGTGTHTFHYAYYRGDIVWGGSLALAASTSSRLFWCEVDLPTSLPSLTTEWHQMPHNGFYEIAHGVTSAKLPYVNYDQTYDRFAFTFQGGPPYELLRETAEFPSGSSGTADVTRWVFRPVARTPSLEPPELGTTTLAYGERFSISIPASPSFTFTVGGTTFSTLVPGDVVYIEGTTVGSGLAMTGVANTPGFFIVTTVTADDFQVRSLDGTEVGNSTGITQVGGMRIAGSSSRNSETYVVTSVRDNGDESVASDEEVVANNLTVPGSSNTLVWTAATNASTYRIYRKLDEVFGLIGETDALTFTDDNIEPNLAKTPPIYDDSLSTDYPTATCHFQQRRFFAGNEEFPQGLWGTRTGTFSTMTRHEPPQADDRIRLNLVGRERALIRHLVPMTHLIALTASTEYRVTGVNEDTLTALSQAARPLSETGASIVRPIVCNSTLLWVGNRDHHVYAMRPQQSQAVEPDDMSVRAAHLFDGVSIVDSAQQKAPYPIEWFLTSAGELLGLTFMPGQNIAGWHVHDTEGVIESICVVPEGEEDRLYLSVLRDVDGVETRFIERMGAIQRPASLDDHQYLDCAVTYDSTAATSIPVAHLEGQEVYALADGDPVGPFTVASGVITLTTAASTVHVGFRNTVTLRTLPVGLQIDGWGKGRELNVKGVWVRVEKTCKFTLGPVDGTAYPASGFGTQEMATRVCPVQISGKWGSDATIEITQEDPLPIEITSLTLEVEVS